METTQVKKVLLHTDESELRKAKARAKQAEKELNDFVGLVGKELKRKLNPEEMEAVKNDALGWLKNSLPFPLPNAPEKMRYDAIGIDIWVIQQAWNKRSWGADRRGCEWEFTLEGNVFKLNDEQTIYNLHYKYATPRQLEVLEQTQALANALNVAAEQGLNVWNTYAGPDTAPLYRLKETFKVLDYDQSQGKMVPDLKAISRIR